MPCFRHPAIYQVPWRLQLDRLQWGYLLAMQVSALDDQIQIHRPESLTDRGPSAVRSCGLGVGYLCGIFSWSDELFYIAVGEDFEFHELFGEFDD